MKPKKFTELQINRAMLKTFEQMNNRMYEKTTKGKYNFTDVTQQDWDDSSFTFPDIIKMTLKNLNKNNNEPKKS